MLKNYGRISQLRYSYTERVYFFKNDSDFRNDDGGGIRHDNLNRYSLARHVTTNWNSHGHADRFRLANIHLGLFDTYWQLKRSFISLKFLNGVGLGLNVLWH